MFFIFAIIYTNQYNISSSKIFFSIDKEIPHLQSCLLFSLFTISLIGI